MDKLSRGETEADRFLPEGLTLDRYEQDLIREALRRANGNKRQAAGLLALTRSALRYRLTQVGLESCHAAGVSTRGRHGPVEARATAHSHRSFTAV
jgi:DNA-binding NtrC family response regulator